MIILIDRIDEPTLVAGKPERMRELVWPMLESKFLQQEGVGIKMLLPIELRYLVRKEGADFFQEARLDKQSVVDRLSWSGATLYDLCTARMRACHKDKESRITLTDIFAEDVPREALLDALGQMGQPRDAFKLLYSTIREHCQSVGEDDAEFRVPRFILDSVRKTGKAVVLHEACKRGGVGGDIAAMIMEEAYDDLVGPVKRICGRNTTVPYNLGLEKVCVPQVADIVQGVLEIL